MHLSRQQLKESIESHKELAQLLEYQLTRTDLPPRTRERFEALTKDAWEFIGELEALLRKSEREEAVLAGLQ